MFRNRQSSDTPGSAGLMYSLVHCPDPCDLRVCVQAAPNAFACRGCDPQLTAGRGGAQRRSPTGGAANGTPRKTVTPLSTVPDRVPCATVATGSAAAAISPRHIVTASIANITDRFIEFSFMSRE